MDEHRPDRESRHLLGGRDPEALELTPEAGDSAGQPHHQHLVVSAGERQILRGEFLVGGTRRRRHCRVQDPNMTTELTARTRSIPPRSLRRPRWQNLILLASVILFWVGVILKIVG
jgi:hypothetical protein